VEGPYLQPIEFYQIKSGEELLQNTYTFKDADGSVFVLRPELTPTVAYMIAKDSPKLNFPLKWWSNPTLSEGKNPKREEKDNLSNSIWISLTGPIRDGNELTTKQR